MGDKYIRNPIKEVRDETKKRSFLVRPNFDTQTKVDSTNLKVQLNKELQEYQREDFMINNRARPLKEIENDVLDTNDEGRKIVMGKEYHKRLLDIFNKLEEKASRNGEKTNFVPREPFLIDILEDPWFE
jgi:DNA repair ATPase RecN